MRVELAAEVFAEADEQRQPYALEDLIALLRRFVDGPHEWVVANPAVAEAAAAYLPKHLPTIAQTYIDLARAACVRALSWTGTTQTTEPVRVSRADLADHCADLCQPAVLVLEDMKSDAYFIRALVVAFGAHRVRVALDREWLVIDHGGGSGRHPDVAIAAASRFRRVVRVIALLDSDRLTPEMRTKHEDKVTRMEAARVAVHVLAAREAENYVPDRVLRHAGHRGRAAGKVALLSRLLPQQRAHLDIKKGLSDVKEPLQVTFFAVLDEDVRQGLQQGFGDKVLWHMHELRDELTEEHFAGIGPDVVPELKALLTIIDRTI